MSLERAIKAEIAAFEKAVRDANWVPGKRVPRSVSKARYRLTDFILEVGEPPREPYEEEEPDGYEDPIFNPEQHDAEA